MKLFQLLFLLLPLSVAVADPHFVSADGFIVFGSGALLVSFVENEVGVGSTVLITMNALGQVEYGCENNKGDISKKTGSNQFLTNAVTWLNGDTAGNLSGDLLGLNVPTPGDFACPKGQTLTRISILYTQISVCDATNNNICRFLPPVQFPI